MKVKFIFVVAKYGGSDALILQIAKKVSLK